MEISQLLSATFAYCWPVLTAVIGYFLLRIMSEFDSMRSDLQHLKTSYAVAQETIADAKQIIKEWSLMKKEISDSAAELRLANEKLEGIAVLKRDRETAFKRIDELRNEIAQVEKDLTERSHVLSNRVTTLRAAVEAGGFKVDFD